jgi:Flp pilus assembly protein TadD
LRVVGSALLLALVALPARGEIETLDAPAESGEQRALIEEYSRALARGPERAELYLKRGHAHFRLREFEHAIENYSTAIRLDPKLDDAWYGRGMARGLSGEVEAAIADLGVYLQRHPASSLAYTKRGVRHIWKGDFENAERDLRRAIELNARNAEAHDDLGVILARRSEFESASRHFATAVQLDPTYHKAWHNLALARYLMDEPERALVAVDGALRLRPEARGSMLLKGAILESLGRSAEARAVREEAEFLSESGGGLERVPVQ